MKVLLDTHTFVWWATDDPKLSAKARSVIASFENEVYVSAVTGWEISTKVRLGKWPGAEVLAMSFGDVIPVLAFKDLPVRLNHAQRAGLLPGEHRDPFDRMLIAQSQAENMPVISVDAVFDEFHVVRIW